MSQISVSFFSIFATSFVHNVQLFVFFLYISSNFRFKTSDVSLYLVFPFSKDCMYARTGTIISLFFVMFKYYIFTFIYFYFYTFLLLYIFIFFFFCLNSLFFLFCLDLCTTFHLHKIFTIISQMHDHCCSCTDWI